MGEDVESVMGGVRMGVNVDIKRTDGEQEIYSFIPKPMIDINCVTIVAKLQTHEPKQRPCVVGYWIRGQKERVQINSPCRNVDFTKCCDCPTFKSVGVSACNCFLSHCITSKNQDYNAEFFN